ncbi:cannabinoid receptor type 1A-like [Clytia hemisphaerica]|uniref:cannabinoid receptor type 1A-like n=1 Tax=Clytia hemisphaerica TaxID=252671 RepID=UPI0034D549DF
MDCVPILTDDQRKAIVSLYLTIAALGTILNVLSLYCQWKTRRTREFNNSARLMASLSVCDFIDCIFVVPVFCAGYHYWKLRSDCAALKAQAVFNNWNALYSSCLIVMITFNRYLKIVKYARYDRIMSRRRNLIINVAAISTSLFISLIAVVNVNSMLLVTTVLVVFTVFSIPTLYALLYKSMRANQQVTPACQRRLRNNKVLKNLLLLTTCYLICNLPAMCLVMYALISKKKMIYFEARVTHAIVCLSSVLNPVIYVLRDAVYRRTLSTLLHLNRVVAQ